MFLQANIFCVFVTIFITEIISTEPCPTRYGKCQNTKTKMNLSSLTAIYTIIENSMEDHPSEALRIHRETETQPMTGHQRGLFCSQLLTRGQRN
uniref:Secreted protein n=1 Tax=Anguilla anguilla TaxID=7936 RepID=A0A0E9WXA4_ANGAN